MKLCPSTILFRHTLSLTIVVWTIISCTGGGSKNPSNPSNPTTPTGGPSFVINSPKEGSSIAGTVYFSAQPFNASQVTSVNFKAENTDLGTDTTASDGFRVFLNSKDFPEGKLTLTATLKGKNGKTSTQNIAVTNIPSPPSESTVTTEGAALGTTEASGALSTLAIPAGAAVGSNVKFEAKTKEEVKAATGVDYDDLGVTFLGAQEISTSKPLESPVAVTSGGFGPMVQPNQIVVNYMIAPDTDDDGVGELMVANTASVTPSGDIISDPIPKIQLGANTVTTSFGTNTLHTLQNGTISGPPGTFIEVEATGFNALSLFGNVALFKSSVDGTEMELPAVVNNHYEDENAVPTIGFYIPPLPAGAATVTLQNTSTNEKIQPITITIETPPALSEAPAVIIDQTLADIITTLSNEPEWVEGINQFSEARSIFAELSDNPTAEEEQALRSIASFIANSNVGDLLNQIEANSPGNLSVQECSVFHFLLFGSITVMGAVIATLGAIAFSLATGGIGGILLGSVGIASLSGGSFFMGIGTTGGLTTYIDCISDLLDPPQTCLPPYTPETLPPGGLSPAGLHAQQTSSSSMTGMGSIFPPGGDGCGSAIGGGENTSSSSLQTQQTGIDDFTGDLAGRFVVKVFFAGGNSVPFTGISDSSGYFYIPTIPADQPFQAIAIDRLTGKTRIFEGTGPKVGRSVFMYFDFLSGEGSAVPTISYNSNTQDSLGDVDIYLFEGKAGDLIKLAIFSGLPRDPDHLNYKLVDPNGQTFGGSSFGAGNLHDTIVFELELDGLYSISIDGSNASGNYTLGLFELGSPKPIASGETVSGSLDTLGEQHYYSISGVADNKLEFTISHGQSSDLFAELTVRELKSGFEFYNAPRRSRIETGVKNRSRTATYKLPETGGYILEVLLGDQFATDINRHLGSYEIKVELKP